MPRKFTKKEYAPAEKVETKKAGIFSSKIFQIVLFIIVVIALGAAAFFFLEYQSAQKKAAELINSKNNPQANAELIGSVGKLMELPQEAPTIATVSDITKLSGQPFFANAQNGDKVLIYQASQKAILFRPSTNKIINVGSINTTAATNPTGAQNPTASASAAPTPTSAKLIKVTILNGTKKSGLARTAVKDLKNDGVNLNATTGNSQNDYDNTSVIDLTGKNSSIVSQIIKFIGGKAGSLPTTETKPTGADILILLGVDFESK